MVDGRQRISRLVLLALTSLLYLLCRRRETPAPQFSSLKRIPASIAIFSSPKPFVDEESVQKQRVAIESWMRIQPKPIIVLMGKHESYAEFASQYPEEKIIVEPEIDENFLGRPLFNSLVKRAMNSPRRNFPAEISVLMNADIVVLEDFAQKLGVIHQNFENWLAFGARVDVAVPVSESNKILGNPKDVREFCLQNGTLHTFGGVDWWAWNSQNPEIVPLFEGNMPPFVYGRAKYDNWLVHEAEIAPFRQVIDATDAIISIHLKHDYAHMRKIGGADVDKQWNVWASNKKSDWEVHLNVHLSQNFGSYRNQLGTAFHSSWKAVSCEEEDEICLIRRHRPASCSCEMTPFWLHTQTDPYRDPISGRLSCGKISEETDEDYRIQFFQNENSIPGNPHTLESLLPQVSRPDKVVIVATVTSSYRQLMMNFICNMRKLGIKHFIIAALDLESYKYAYLRGAPVYFESFGKEHHLILQEESRQNCSFRTDCFKSVTKLKSRLLLRVLRLGYHAIFSDLDIIWFKDVTDDLLSFGPGTFPIQSNEPDLNLPANGMRRINSGFYLARSEPSVIQALTAIVRHAFKTSVSEQPSFFDVLCGSKGNHRVGDNECNWKGLQVIFLDRRFYPNGAVFKTIWNHSLEFHSDEFSEFKILHNNWISGTDKKLDRLHRIGSWFVSEDEISCRWSWNG